MLSAVTVIPFELASVTRAWRHKNDKASEAAVAARAAAAVAAEAQATTAMAIAAGRDAGGGSGSGAPPPQQQRRAVTCRCCELGLHEADALYCKRCGAPLPSS